MAGNYGSESVESLTPRSSSAPPIEITSTKTKDGNRKRGEFSEEHRIEYTTINRDLSLVINKEGYKDRVNVVQIELEEVVEGGKGSATFEARVARDDTYGAVCCMVGEFEGSVKVQKGKYSLPPIPATEIIAYGCSETQTPSVFFVEKKNNMEVVEAVTVAHCFMADEDSVYTVTIKIRINKHAGLYVEMEGPIRCAGDYMEKLIMRFSTKAKRRLDFPANCKDVKGQSQGYNNRSTARSFNGIPRGLVNNNGDIRGNGNGNVFVLLDNIKKLF